MTSGTAHGLGVMFSDELDPRQLITLAELAEDVGYGELWYTDQRFWRDCYAGLTLVARHTRRLRVGPGVNDPFTRHPSLIAMAIATLDEIAEGRAQLGLGVGGSGIAQMKLPKTRPVRALEEAIDLIRLMLAGGVVRYDGEIFALDGGQLGFQPVRPSIPIVVATHSPKTLRLGGRVADGVLLGNMGRREAIDEATSIVRTAERDAGRAAGSVAINLRLEVIVSDDRARAVDRMKHRLASRLVSSFLRWEYLEGLGIRPSSELVAAAKAKNVDSVVEFLSDADVQATALVGTPDEAAAHLATLLTPEISRVTIRPYSFEGQGQDVTVRTFAEQVWPAATAQWTPKTADGTLPSVTPS